MTEKEHEEMCKLGDVLCALNKNYSGHRFEAEHVGKLFKLRFCYLDYTNHMFVGSANECIAFLHGYLYGRNHNRMINEAIRLAEENEEWETV